MYPIAFSIGGLHVYTHGLLIAAGAFFGGALIFYLAKIRGLPRYFLFDTLVFSLFAGIIGARIFYIIFYYYQFPNWHEMFFFWYGGLVSFGGIITGFLVAYWLLKRRHQNVWQWFDIGIIGLMFGWFFGRIGCFLAGDVAGIDSASKIAIWGQIPVALFEAGWALLVCLGLLFVFIKRRDYLAKMGDCFLFFIGIAAYALGRFVIDFFRQENIVYYLKGGQIAGLVLLLISLLVLYFLYLKKVQSKGEFDAGKDF